MYNTPIVQIANNKMQLKELSLHILAICSNLFHFSFGKPS